MQKDIDPSEIVTHFVNLLQAEIASEQKKLCRQLIEKINMENAAYVELSHKLAADSSVVSKIRFSYDRTLTSIEYTYYQRHLYASDVNIFLKYRQEFVTPAAWDNEKANIRQKIVAEQQFLNELQSKVTTHVDKREAVKLNIAELKEKIERLKVKMEPLQDNVTQLLSSL